MNKPKTRSYRISAMDRKWGKWSPWRVLQLDLFIRFQGTPTLSSQSTAAFPVYQRDGGHQISWFWEESLREKFKFYSKLATTLPITLRVPVDLDNQAALLRPGDSYSFDIISSTEWKSKNFVDPPFSLFSLHGNLVPTLDSALYLLREWATYQKTCITNRETLQRQPYGI